LARTNHEFLLYRSTVNVAINARIKIAQGKKRSQLWRNTTMRVRELVLGSLAITASLQFAVGATAQVYPSRPITIVVPYTAGSPTDIVGRLIAESMSRTLKTPVLIENVGGTRSRASGESCGRRPQIKAFAVTTPTRLKSLLNVPTASEADLKDLEISVWHGLYAPSGTPEYALDQLNDALKRGLKYPHIITRLADLGTEPVAEEGASREVHRAFLASEVARWKPIIEAAGAFVE